MLFFEDKKYKKIEKSVIFLEKNETLFSNPCEMTDFSILIGGGSAESIVLRADSHSRRVLNISGYFPTKNWIYKKIELKKDVKKSGIKYKKERFWNREQEEKNKEDLPIYISRQTGWICIGEDDNDSYDQCIKFMDNAILCLYKHRFKALWIDPIYRSRIEKEN